MDDYNGYCFVEFEIIVEGLALIDPVVSDLLKSYVF